MELDKLPHDLRRLLQGLHNTLADYMARDEAATVGAFFDLVVSAYKEEVIEAIERTGKFEVVEYDD